MKIEFAGTIPLVRDVEDTIRATKCYTEGVFTRREQHPIQGQEFPSKLVTKFYEVYPDVDLDKMRSLWDAALTMSDWLWGEVTKIDVRFQYDYRINKAKVIVYGGKDALRELNQGIPKFMDTLAKVSVGENESNVQPVVGDNDRLRVSPVANP